MNAPPKDDPLWEDGTAMLAWMVLIGTSTPLSAVGLECNLHRCTYIAMDASNLWYAYTAKPRCDIKDGAWWPDIDISGKYAWRIGQFPCHIGWPYTLMEVNKEK